LARPETAALQAYDRSGFIRGILGDCHYRVERYRRGCARLAERSHVAGKTRVI